MPNMSHRISTMSGQLEALKSALIFIYWVAAAIGALTTFAYLWIINYFPSGMTPGEVLYFLFIALALAIVYFLILLYGAFTMLWLANGAIKLRDFASFKDSEMAAILFGASNQSSGGLSVIKHRWHLYRLHATRVRINNLVAMPRALRGWWVTTISLFAFILFFSRAAQFESVSFTELVFASMIAGFVALTFACVRPDSSSRAQARARLLCLIFAPALIVAYYFGPGPFLKIVFQRIGVYAPKVSLELPEAEIGVIERISAHIDRPLLDCNRLNPAMLLVHGVDVLWTSIGDRTVVRFDAVAPKRGLFSPVPVVPYVQITFDSKSVRIFSTTPRLDPCFVLAAETIFKARGSSFDPHGKGQVDAVSATVKSLGKPAKVSIVSLVASNSASSPPSTAMIADRSLAEQRARALASALRLQNAAVDVEYTLKDATDCPLLKTPDSANTVASDDATRCDGAVGRIEVSVTYRR